jgi:hypothetical protein
MSLRIALSRKLMAASLCAWPVAPQYALNVVIMAFLMVSPSCKRMLKPSCMGSSPGAPPPGLAVRLTCAAPPAQVAAATLIQIPFMLYALGLGKQGWTAGWVVSAGAQTPWRFCRIVSYAQAQPHCMQRQPCVSPGLSTCPVSDRCACMCVCVSGYRYVALFGAIIASTDAASVAAVLRSGGWAWGHVCRRVSEARRAAGRSAI